MKNLFSIMLCMAFINSNGQNNLIHIIPQPVELRQNEGFYLVTKATVVSFNQPGGRKTADMLAQKLNTSTGYKLLAQQGKKGSIQLNLNKTVDLRLGNEGYTIESTSKAVIISANQPAGLFYGMQTLLQLLPKEIESNTIANANWTIPAVKITDYPRFAWRGIMLDVSRHFFTKEDVELYIDQLAKFKFNTFHWHLTDDNGWRIEIKSLPKLTTVGAWRVARAGRFGNCSDPKPGEAATYGGFYNQDDIREIIRFAQERNVIIIPEIDVPGHSMAAIAAYPELSCTKDTNTMVNPGTAFSEWYDNGTFKMLVDNTLNPSDEKVYEFLDKVFTEVASLFPGPYIHIGGDECYKGYWENNKDCQALMKKLNMSQVENLQGYFVNRLEGILKEKNKKLIGWDEILEGGVSPDATVMSWRGIKGGIEAAKTGHNVVMTPTTFAYLDYCQGDPTIDPPIYANLRLKNCYSFNPVPDSVDAKYILGGQGNLWTEQVPSLRYAQYMTFPRAWALAEVFWSAEGKLNWENFIDRVEGQFNRADIACMNYSRAIYDAIITPFMKDNKMWLQMDTEFPGLDIYYTIDETMPDSYSARYTEAVGLPDEDITLRVITYRNGKPVGHLITLNHDELIKRAL
jgi:hexosaminidase